MKKKKNVLTSVLAVITGFCAPVAAEIVVTGSSPVSINEAPISVTAIDSEQLVNQGEVSVSDLINRLPAMYPGPSSKPVSIRGDTAGPLVFVDGTVVSGGVDKIDPATIGSVEIISAVEAAAVWGTSAAGGIINITTKPEYPVADPTGSYTLPGVQGTIGNYTIALQDMQQCNATDGNHLPAWVYFPRHDYGVGDFSADRKTQYWGSEFGNFSPRNPVLPWQGESLSAGGGDKHQEPSLLNSYTKWFELYERIVSSPAIRQSDRMAFAVTMVFNYTALNQTYSDAAYALGIFDPDRVYERLLAAYAARSGDSESDLTSRSSPRYQLTYNKFLELLWRIMAHPTVPEDVKAQITYMMLFAPPSVHPMFSDLSYALGTFDPDYIFENVSEYYDLQAASTQFTEFFKLYQKLMQHPIIPASDKVSITIALIMNHAALSPDVSDAAFALGMFDPDEAYSAVIDAYRSQYRYAIQDYSTVEPIDESAELFDKWRGVYEKLMADPAIPLKAKMELLNALLFYNVALSQAVSLQGFNLQSFDADALFNFYFSQVATIPEGQEAKYDPFVTHFAPPLEAFDLRFCNPEQQEQIRYLIKRRDVERDTVNQLWDYHRLPDTSKADKTAAVTDALDAEARMEAHNLELLELWKQCTGTAVVDEAPDTDREAVKPNIEIRVVRPVEDESGNVTKEPEVGAAVELRRQSYESSLSNPWQVRVEWDISMDAALGTSRMWTDSMGYARPNGNEKNAAPPDDPLEDSDWQIRFNADTGRIGLQIEQVKIDGIVQHFGGMGRSDMSFDQLPKETRDSIPEQWKVRANDGHAITDNFYVAYNFNENLPGLDPRELTTVTGSTFVENDQCGDSALPPEGSGYLTATETAVKSVADSWALEHVGVAGDMNQSSQPIVVAVIDTGIDWNHLDFARENLWRNDGETPDNGIDDDGNGYVDDIIGWDFFANDNKPWDNDGHGTFVAGVIAATHGNDAGIDGINPQARIMVLKALNNFGRTRASYVARAIAYAVDNGARIINLSVTGPGFPKVVQDAVNYANDKGVLVIVAAGNRAEDIDNATPSRLRGAMYVGATDQQGSRAVFSNVGSALNIAAPGVDVVSLKARATDFMYSSATTSYVPGDAVLGEDKRYYRATGTSFATPIVSGIASLVWANNPDLSARDVKRILEQSARDVEVPGRDRLTGYGVVDAKAALAADPAYFIHADIPAVQRIDVADGTFLQVIGVADANLFAKAALELGQGENPERFTPVGDPLLDRVGLGELGRIPAAAFEGGDTWTIRLIVEHAEGRKREARYVVDLR